MAHNSLYKGKRDKTIILNSPKFKDGKLVIADVIKKYNATKETKGK